MAKTYPKRHLSVSAFDRAFLDFAERDWPEGATQTFPAGSPLMISSGNLIVWDGSTANPIFGIALDAGHNGAAAANNIRLCITLPEILLQGNFMGSAGADNVLAAADRGLTRDLATTANFPSTSANGWYISDTNADVAVTIFDFRTNFVHPTSSDDGAVAGDTNAIILAQIIPGKSRWY